LNADEVATEVPAGHAEALLEACPGKLTLERSIVPLKAERALVDRILSPGSLDLVSIEFINEDQGINFVAPAWFGVEVTEEVTYTNLQIAISGLPVAPITEASNDGLDALLDILESKLAGLPLSEGARGDGRPAEHDSDVVRPLPFVLPSKAREGQPSPLENKAATSLEENARRPVLPTASRTKLEGDDRLAGVIEGLSSSLARSTLEADPSDVDAETQRRWRWSSH
jgi:hypothetical protein